jgi:hypothetical protein
MPKVTHPGVILSFETKKFGPMRYFTDVFDGTSRYVWKEGGYKNRSAPAIGNRGE